MVNKSESKGLIALFKFSGWRFLEVSSFVEAAEILNQYGLRTKDEKPFDDQSVAGIIQNEEHRTTGTISEDVWVMCEAILNTPADKRRISYHHRTVKCECGRRISVPSAYQGY